MSNVPRFTFTLVIAGLVLLVSLPASALIMTGSGNQPVHDAGWPEGALAVANLESRVGWWEGPPFGGGDWHFLYRGDTSAFQEALAAFAAIRAPALELVVHDGPHEDGVLKKPADWTLNVWVPANWHRLFNNPRSLDAADQPQFRRPVDPPRLDVYVGGGGVNWTKVKVPAGLNVRDERAAASAVSPGGGAVLRADIYDMATGKPVAGARVVVAVIYDTMYGRPAVPEKVTEATSDAAGRVEITRLPAGNYRLTFGADGYAARMFRRERLGERDCKQLTVELARAAVLDGRVTDTEGRPLKDVRVAPVNILALNGLGYKGPDEPGVTTDADGRFALTGLPTGYVQLRAAADGYHFSDLFTIHDVPGTEVQVRLGRAGAIRISVTDKEGRALSRYEGNEILVEVEPKGGSKIGLWSGSAKVKDDGTFEFNHVPPGEYRIRSHPNPYNSDRQYAPEHTVTVAPGAPAEVKVIYE